MIQMTAKIGDVVIDRAYNKSGKLSIVVGTGICQPILLSQYRGDKLIDYFSTWKELEVIGHIDFEAIWEQAVQIKALKDGE